VSDLIHSRSRTIEDGAEAGSIAFVSGAQRFEAHAQLVIGKFYHVMLPR
jgi:hypothetical protein